MDRLDFGVDLVETSAPEGYVLDETPVRWRCRPGSEPVDAGVFINVEGWATLAADKTAYEFGPDGTLVESDGVGVPSVTRWSSRWRRTARCRSPTSSSRTPWRRPHLRGGLGRLRPGWLPRRLRRADPHPHLVGGDLDAGQVVTVYFVATLTAAPAAGPGEDALAVDNVALAVSDVVPEAWSDTVRVAGLGVEPADAGRRPAHHGEADLAVAAGHGAVRPVEAAVVAGPHRPRLCLQPPSAAAPMLVLGAGMWRVATRHEH